MTNYEKNVISLIDNRIEGAKNDIVQTVIHEVEASYDDKFDSRFNSKFQEKFDELFYAKMPEIVQLMETKMEDIVTGFLKTSVSPDLLTKLQSAEHIIDSASGINTFLDAQQTRLEDMERIE